MKQSIIRGDLNVPQVDWKGVAEGMSGTQEYINRLVWENGYKQVVETPTRGDSLPHYWMFTSLDLKVNFYLAILHKGSVIIAGCY
jgi:hypothetical protein